MGMYYDKDGKPVCTKKDEKKMESEVVGIDLGTTYSCVGVWRESQVIIMPNDLGQRVTPSCVSFTDEQMFVGDAAKNQILFDPTQVIYDSKRMLGKRFNDKTLVEDMKHWPFRITEGGGGSIQIHVTLRKKAEVYGPEHISGFVLNKMREMAEKHLGRKIENAVVTVPAYFNDAQRSATRDAGILAGVNIIRLVNEPTAACMAYGLHKFQDEKTSRTVVIFDLGGGTFDVSVFRVDRGLFEVASTNGDNHLGGEDFDLTLANYFIEDFIKKNPTKYAVARTDARIKRRFKNCCERAKRTLSRQLVTSIDMDAVVGGDDYTLTMTRARLEDLLKDLFDRLKAPLVEALADAGYLRKKPHDIVLVGGSTRIPAVRE